MTLLEQGATERDSGKKTYTLTQFPKVLAELTSLTKNVKNRNLGKFKQVQLNNKEKRNSQTIKRIRFVC